MKPEKNPYRKKGAIKPTSAEDAKKRFNGVELEKNDLPAMIIAAFVTFLPALLVVIGVLVLVVYGFFLR